MEIEREREREREGEKEKDGEGKREREFAGSRCRSAGKLANSASMQTLRRVRAASAIHLAIPIIIAIYSR
jgi:protein involved in sex pheromone biosynthesis